MLEKHLHLKDNIYQLRYQLFYTAMYAPYVDFKKACNLIGTSPSQLGAKAVIPCAGETAHVGDNFPVFPKEGAKKSPFNLMCSPNCNMNNRNHFPLTK